MPEPREHPAAMMARISYGKSDLPDHPDNQGVDFQRGYHIALAFGDKPGGDIIDEEWRIIGEPETIPASFSEFKRGVWAYTMRRLFDQVLSVKPSPPSS